MHEISALSYTELTNKIMEVRGVKERRAKSIIAEAVQNCIILKKPDERYYLISKENDEENENDELPY